MKRFNFFLSMLLLLVMVTGCKEDFDTPQQTPPPHPSTLAPQIAMAHAPVTTRRGGWILGTVAILAIIAGVLAWTNPTRAQHLNAINEVTAEWVGDKVDQHNPGNFLLGELFKLLGNTGTGFAIDHYLKVQSYGVCSIGRIEVGNKPHIVSVGVLGHVYTFDKQDIERTVDLLTLLLGAVAGISLVVGGIGIMNIMYVSVTERTREIGLRMSVGARGVDILSQFLIEAIMISVTGGLIGVLLGMGASAAVESVVKWPISVQPWTVMLAFAVCTFTGIFFGWYPAKKAANLDPIEAIRYE